MGKRLSRRIALASAAVLLVSAVSAPVALATTYTDDSDFDTTCAVSGSTTLTTTFDVTSADWYWIVWRTDAGSRSKIVGSVLKYYATGNDQSETATTARTGPFIVGIVRLSTGARDYVTCS